MSDVGEMPSPKAISIPFRHCPARSSLYLFNIYDNFVAVEIFVWIETLHMADVLETICRYFEHSGLEIGDTLQE